MFSKLYNDRSLGLRATTPTRHRCRSAIMLSCSMLALAGMASATTITLGGGGTLTTTVNDTYVDNTGPYSIVSGFGGGGLLLKPNATGNNDTIVLQGTTINVTNIQIANEGRAVDIGSADILGGTYHTSGSYSVVLQGSSLTAKANYGEAAFSALTQSGTITLDTTGGASNTINGAYGYVVGASSNQDVSAVLKIGADQITAYNGQWISDGIYVIPNGHGSVAIDTAGAMISVPGGYFTRSVAGIYVQGGLGDVTLGGANGGLSGTITVPNSYGISVSGETTRITLSSSETISARSGIYVSAHNAIIDSFGTIIAGTDPAITGTVDIETVTLESGSRTVGKIKASQGSGSVNTFNIYAGADISSTTFEGNASGTNSIHLKGAGSAIFDIAKLTSIPTIQKDDAGTWSLTNSGSSQRIDVFVNAGTLQVSADSNLGAATGSLTLGSVSGAGTLRFGSQFDLTSTRLITLGAGGGYIDTNYRNTTISQGVTGAGSLGKAGEGTLTLAGTNTYTGGTTISGGTLQLGVAGGSVGSVVGAITNYSNLNIVNADTSGVTSITNNVAVWYPPTVNFWNSTTAGTATVTNNNGYVYFNDTSTADGATITNNRAGVTIFRNSSSAGNATITANVASYIDFFDTSTAGDATIINAGGWGTTSFSHSSSAGNATVINAGILTFSGSSTAATANISTNGGHTSFADFATAGQASLVTDATGIVDFSWSTGPNNDQKLSAGSIAGAGSYYIGANQFTVGGTGLSTIVSGAIKDCGPDRICTPASAGGSLVKVGAGTLVLSGTNTYTGGTTINGGTLQIGNGGSTGSVVGNITDNGILAINRSDAVSFGGVISGSGSLNQNGSGTLILTGANTYTGATTIQSGVLALSGSGSVAASSGVTDNGTFDIVATTSGAAISTLAGNGSVVLGNKTLTISNGASEFSGVIGGNGGVAIGGGSQILTGANTYTGGTTISGGTLQIGNGGTTGSVIGNITDNGTLVFNHSDAVTFGGVISGTGSLSQNGSGTLILTGANTYTGGTTIASGATLQLGDGDTSGSILGNVIDNGVLVFDRSDTYTFAGDISGTGTLSFVGSGSVVFTGRNSLSGTIDIGADTTVHITDPGGFGGAIVDNGTLDFNGSGSQTFANAISGNGALTLTGSGTVIFTGTNTYTGGTTITSGTLQIGTGGTSGFITGPIANNGTVLFDHSDGYIVSGVISGSGSLRQEGTGVLVLTGTNTYTGNTFVDAGMVSISSDANLGNGGTLVLASGTGVVFTGSGTFTHAVTVAGDPAFAVASGTTVTWAGQISDGSAAGDVEVTGGGTLVLTGTNTYTGGTAIASGSTLQLGNGGTTGAVAGNIIDNGTLVFNRSDDLAFAGTISGAGGLTKNNTNTLTLNGINSYSGVTTVASGGLVVGDAAHAGAAIDSHIGGVTVAAGASLSGFGKIAGPVTNNGTVVTGQAAGSLTVGSFVQNASGKLQVELSPSLSSHLAVSGAAALGGTLRVNALSGTGAAHVYSVLNASRITGVFDTVTVTGLPADAVYGVRYATGGQEVDVVTMPTSAGQIYGDLRIAAFDTAFTLNNIVMDRLSSDKAASGAWTLWARGTVGSAHTDAGNGASAFNSNLAGFIGGADYGFENGMSAHAAVAYAQSDLKVNSHATKASTSSLYVSLAGHAPVSAFMLDAEGFYLRNSTDLTRDTEFAGIAHAKPDNSVFGFAVQMGIPLLQGYVVPSLRLSYAGLDQSAVGETGADPMNLAAASVNTNQLRGDVGLRYAPRFVTGSETVLVPSLKVFLDQRLSATPDRMAMQLVGTLSSFAAPSAEADRTAALIGGGIKAEIGGDLSLDLDLNARLGSHQTAWTSTAGLAWHF